MDIKITHKIKAVINATINKVDFLYLDFEAEIKNDGGIDGAADLARRNEFELRPIIGRKYASSTNAQRAEHSPPQHSE